MGFTLLGNKPAIGGGMSGSLDDDIAYYRIKNQFPTLDKDAELAGWSPDGKGNYTRKYNGISQTLPASMLASQLNEQKQATQLSAPVQIGNVGGNYLAQIQRYLEGPPQSVMNNYEASPQYYDNPYEQRLLQLMNNPDSISDTNAYKFRFNQGQQALERAAASRGMLNSGNTLAALADYGQGVASQEYGNEFDRLSSAVGQRNQYNLGRAGAANQERELRNQELGIRRQWYGDQANTALKALTNYDENLINARNSAAHNAIGLGRINAGENYRPSTW